MEATPIELPTDDVEMIDSKDKVNVVAKLLGMGKRERGSKIDKAKTTPASQTVLVAPTPSPCGPIPSSLHKMHMYLHTVLVLCNLK